MQARLFRLFMTSKNEDYVRKKLKLNGLKEDAFRNHDNYKYLLQYVNTLAQHRVREYDIWNELGFDKVDEVTRVSTENFKVYKAFVNKFDDRVALKYI
ncbi:hypothetical protein PPTG_08130 [Phytophthora nicotianae INRA-310]|uniref:RxLR effector protein n=1 Tax=Phytophthora nicotianae (strain INRA-310) TaxID=761204 RepID=W2QLY2_PHYN3|nr:hypothetical protein PPTG_08130 [Phytophthora nicotianae INRA-310]ETN13250.1 hypothetical protein PPTG_08130 [Phytophthora nicotianae INRA-310]